MTNKNSMYKQVLKDHVCEKIKLGVIVIDESGNIQYVNRRCEEILCINRNKSLGRHYNDVFAHIPSDERYTLITLETGKEFENILHVHFDNGRFYITDTVLLKDGNKVIGAAAVFKDVTDVRNIQEKIEESIKLSTIGHMAAGTAHEIRNPLTTVKGLLQLIEAKLEKGTLWRNNLQEYTSMMLEEIDKINEIITDFIFLAEPSKPFMKKIDVNDLITSVAGFTRGEALRLDIHVILELSKDLFSVCGDSKQLKQVLLNVFNNAYQAMVSGGSLLIKTYNMPVENMVAIEINDTGQGMPEHVIEKIYDPFFTTKNEGIGLGLAIAKRVLHIHGGNIRVHSQPGLGTCFTILLPALTVAELKSIF